MNYDIKKLDKILELLKAGSNSGSLRREYRSYFTNDNNSDMEFHITVLIDDGYIQADPYRAGSYKLTPQGVRFQGYQKAENEQNSKAQQNQKKQDLEIETLQLNSIILKRQIWIWPWSAIWSLLSFVIGSIITFIASNWVWVSQFLGK